MKVCSKCGEEKAYSEFHKKSDTKDGYSYICKLCRSIDGKERGKRLADIAREAGHGVCYTCKIDTPIELCYSGGNSGILCIECSRISKFGKAGYVRGWYNKKFLEQDGKCAICGSTEHGQVGRLNLCIDHCHGRNILRGLLCGECNKMVGNHTSDRLLAGAEYVERFA